MIPIYSYTQSIVFAITYHPSYGKYTEEERVFNGNVKCSRAQNTFQLLPTCTCRARHDSRMVIVQSTAIKKTGKDVRKYDYSRHNARRRLKGVKVYFTGVQWSEYL